VVDSVQNYDRDSRQQSNFEAKLTQETRDRSSQTDFPENLKHEEVLGQYLENKLKPDFTDLKVGVGSSLGNPPYASPEIVIVEYEQEEII